MPPTSRGCLDESTVDWPCRCSPFHRRLHTSRPCRGNGSTTRTCRESVRSGGNARRAAGHHAAAVDPAEKCRACSAADRAAGRRRCATAPPPLRASPLWLALCLLATVPDLLAAPLPQPHLLEPDPLVLLMRVEPGI